MGKFVDPDGPLPIEETAELELPTDPLLRQLHIAVCLLENLGRDLLPPLLPDPDGKIGLDNWAHPEIGRVVVPREIKYRLDEAFAALKLACRLAGEDVTRWAPGTPFPWPPMVSTDV
jgi:hypothetical protein